MKFSTKWVTALRFKKRNRSQLNT